MNPSHQPARSIKFNEHLDAMFTCNQPVTEGWFRNLQPQGSIITQLNDARPVLTSLNVKTGTALDSLNMSIQRPG